MTKIKCCKECVYCKDGICTKEEIEMNTVSFDCYEYIYCMDYEEK